MRSFILIPLFAALAAADAMQEESDSLYQEGDNSYMPMFTEDQLKYPITAPLDIACSYYEANYNPKIFTSKSGNVKRVVFHAPDDTLFKEINHDNVRIFDPESFLGYKVVVDYINDTARYVQIYGLVSRGIYGVRYLVNTNKGFQKVSRPLFIRHRTQHSTAYTLDLQAPKEQMLEHNTVRSNESSPHNMTTYYPRFNHYVETIVAGSSKLWEHDPVAADICLKVMTYTFDGQNYCVVRTMDWNGLMEEFLFVEGKKRYTLLAHIPKDSFYTQAADAAAGTAKSEPKLINYTQILPRRNGAMELFNTAKLIKVNFRGEPTANDHWTLTKDQTPSGNHEEVFTPEEGTLIYRLTDGKHLVWHRPGLAIKRGSLISTVDGSEFLQLTVINDEGATLEYYFQKHANYWWPISKSQVLRKTNPKALEDTTEDNIRITVKNLNHEQLEALKQRTRVRFDTEKIEDPAWTTDRLNYGNMLTRKYCTARKPEYVFDGFVSGDETIVDLKGKYLSTETLHYRVKGLDLLAFNAFNLENGKGKLYFFLKREKHWIPIGERVFNRFYDDIMAYIYSKRIKGGDEDEGYSTDTDATRQPDVDVELPFQHEFDEHTGGHKVDQLPTEEEKEEGEGEEEEEKKEPTYIRLQLKGYQDDNCTIHTVSGDDKSVRIIYTPNEGYLFDEVHESQSTVFAVPGFTVTEVILDQMPDGQHFLQVIAHDKEGLQRIFYYYKIKKYYDFKEISRANYTNIRYRCMARFHVDITSKNRRGKCLIRLDSKHYKNVRAFIPRYNCVIDVVKHKESPIWTFDELNPEVVTRIVTFNRDNIRGVLLQVIDAKAEHVERLYLNTNPKTNDYALFVHKGEMFALFKEYLLNRRSGIPGFRKYKDNDIDWTNVIDDNSPEYSLIRPGYRKEAVEEKPEEHDAEEGAEEEGEEEGEEGDAASVVSGDVAGSHLEGEEEKETPIVDPEAEEAEKARKETLEARLRHKNAIKESSYYVSLPLVVHNVIHKEGIVWDAAGSGEVCLDFRKYSKNQYRLVECEIMSPDGRVEIRYFMNTHNGRGHYKEVELCKIGSDI
ncbi:uncharacterized protein BXIN_1936 [Babesia sp. Xinjiang]|uniref:uncharacterized protein n=1 Tax=Babesia sp. Xinjiang TaxID=462227 RepID=UPI000A234BD4|nr:uncharacterized protein BXIN_1936 [Babesia sp. Xinjiang]ORM40276.1 hypothetical protein BXIN_1936 [Babesia sp. Xinjiang]